MRRSRLKAADRLSVCPTGSTVWGKLEPDESAMPSLPPPASTPREKIECADILMDEAILALRHFIRHLEPIPTRANIRLVMHWSSRSADAMRAVINALMVLPPGGSATLGPKFEKLRRLNHEASARLLLARPI